MKLSIAMTTYNGEAYLAEQLRSFADQVRRPDQLVVCDDQSSDRTLEIVRDFGDRVDFEVLAIRNGERLGVVRNFSKAIDACRGDVIFLSDQDDVWHPDKLRRHEQVYLDDPREEVGLVFNNAELVDLDLKPLGRTTFDVFNVDEGVIAELASDRALFALIRQPRISGCTLSIRSSFWKRLPEARGPVYHDQTLSYAAAMLSRIVAIREPLNFYRQHATQALGTGAPEAADAPVPPMIRQRWIEDQTIEHATILDLIERLHLKGAEFPYHHYRNYMLGFLAHQWRRVSYPKSRLRRWPQVFCEFLLGHYSRYHDDVRSTVSLDLRQRHFDRQE